MVQGNWAVLHGSVGFFVFFQFFFLNINIYFCFCFLFFCLINNGKQKQSFDLKEVFCGFNGIFIDVLEFQMRFDGMFMDFPVF